ncbi:MAG TPA: hypothetical protein VNH22_12480, partial [Blastocatellia bacterium]|nr:hypothetical protein [Blastocatellia bacterium]
TTALHHVRAALGSFAPGGANNPLGLPVFLRFRMSSDSATSAGPNGGWYIDNLAISNLTPAGCGTELVRAADNRPNAGAARFASSTASKAARLLAFARERAGGALPFPARLSRGRARGGSVQA